MIRVLVRGRMGHGVSSHPGTSLSEKARHINTLDLPVRMYRQVGGFRSELLLPMDGSHVKVPPDMIIQSKFILGMFSRLFSIPSLSLFAPPPLSL